MAEQGTAGSRALWERQKEGRAPDAPPSRNPTLEWAIQELRHDHKPSATKWAPDLWCVTDGLGWPCPTEIVIREVEALVVQGVEARND